MTKTIKLLEDNIEENSTQVLRQVRQIFLQWDIKNINQEADIDNNIKERAWLCSSKTLFMNTNLNLSFSHRMLSLENFFNHFRI